MKNVVAILEVLHTERQTVIARVICEFSNFLSESEKVPLICDRYYISGQSLEQTIGLWV
jgi:hypothetical protein